MDLVFSPSKLSGTVKAPASEDEAIRLLICGALSKPSAVIGNICMTDNVLRLINALKVMGSQLSVKGNCISFAQITFKTGITVDCGDSFSTLAYVLPVAAAHGIAVTFRGSQSIAKSGLSEFIGCLAGHGIRSDYSGEIPFSISGDLGAGIYELSPDIPSQLISGLMLALAAFGTDSMIAFSSALEDRAYIDMTLGALRQSHIQAVCTADKFIIRGGQRYRLSKASAGGDFLIAANFAAANAMNSDVSVTGLDAASLQPEAAVLKMLHSVMRTERKSFDYDFSGCQRLAPIMAVYACSLSGESSLNGVTPERADAVCSMINGAGGLACIKNGCLRVTGVRRIRGGTVDSCDVPEMVFAAAVLSTLCKGNLTVRNAESVTKCYPEFFDVFSALGGIFAVHD